MYEAMKNTQKAILIHPSDKTTHYNLALVQQSYAQQVSDLPQEQRSSTNMKRAIKCLECGQQTFRMLINVPVDEFVWYDRKIAEQRERYGETLRTQLERKIVDQVSYEQEKEQKLQVARKKRNDERAKELAAKEKIREEEALRRSELEETRRKLMEKVREDNLQMATQQMELDEFEEEKKSKKRTRKRRDNDDDIERDPEEEEYERLLNKKDKKVKQDLYFLTTNRC
jgi:RNA polymerase-associated protein CTR9